ncbi:UNVERIFIED_CONTAM: hypothetical protein NCL1_39801 [Trichonephila clavipes]
MALALHSGSLDYLIDVVLSQTPKYNESYCMIFRRPEYYKHSSVTMDVVFGFTFEEKKLEQKNIKKICGFRKCSEDQCCVGNFVIGYCLSSPGEGEPCANRTSKKEEYFCGRCGDSMKCAE